MIVSNFDQDDIRFHVHNLSEAINFKRDLPNNIFTSDNWRYYFFERPLLDSVDLVSGLIVNSFREFRADVFVKFSGSSLLAESMYGLDAAATEADVLLIGSVSRTLLGGKIGYPIVVFSSMYEWIAFESAHEEFGVIAVKKDRYCGGFKSHVESNFISLEQMKEMAVGTGYDGIIAKAFVMSYST